MSLDLSKEREPRLGRGRVPKEVKERLEHERTPPSNDAVARVAAKSRRLARQGRDIAEEITEGLRQVGGPWEKPEVWQPQYPRQRKDFEEYVAKIEFERGLPAMDARLNLFCLRVFARLGAVQRFLTVQYDSTGDSLALRLQNRGVNVNGDAVRHHQDMDALVTNVINRVLA